MPSPPPFIIRLYLPSDFNAALSVIQAAAQADGLPQRHTADELRARLRIASSDPRVNPADDLWVVAVRAAGLVAYADGWLTCAGRQPTYRPACFLHPAPTGPGIGRAPLTRP